MHASWHPHWLVRTLLMKVTDQVWILDVTGRNPAPLMLTVAPRVNQEVHPSATPPILQQCTPDHCY